MSKGCCEKLEARVFKPSHDAIQSGVLGLVVFQQKATGEKLQYPWSHSYDAIRGGIGACVRELNDRKHSTGLLFVSAEDTDSTVGTFRWRQFRRQMLTFG